MSAVVEIRSMIGNLPKWQINALFCPCENPSRLSYMEPFRCCILGVELGSIAFQIQPSLEECCSCRMIDTLYIVKAIITFFSPNDGYSVRELTCFFVRLLSSLLMFRERV